QPNRQLPWTAAAYRPNGRCAYHPGHDQYAERRNRDFRWRGPRMTRADRHKAPVVVTLEGDNTHLANLCGPLDENLRQIADGWNVSLSRRGDRVSITGEQAKAAAKALELFHRRAVHKALSIDDIQLGLVELGAGRTQTPDEAEADVPELPELPPVDDLSLNLRTRKSDLRPRTPRQREYLNHILRHDITFGVGPAGTGKTWLAVAC